MAPKNAPDVKVVIFGPVKSRRLGNSLGINVIPPKTCSLNCLYCQMGPTPKTTVTRRSYLAPDKAAECLRKALARVRRKVDFITFSGCGEPTLNRDLGEIIAEIKKITSIPVAVITNSTLLASSRVRASLLNADVILPSLDAVTEKMFTAVNRPHPGLKAKTMVGGLKALRREFRGKIFLEILLLRGLNDCLPEIRALAKAAAAIKPDKIQLNTVVRQPADSRAVSLSRKELGGIKKFFGRRCRIIAGAKDKRSEILKTLAGRVEN